jgi:hypothetical protein
MTAFLPRQNAAFMSSADENAISLDVAFFRIIRGFVEMMAVTVMHEEMHKRARKHDQEWQRVENVSPMPV